VFLPGDASHSSVTQYSSLVGSFVSYGENGVLWIPTQIFWLPAVSERKSWSRDQPRESDVRTFGTFDSMTFDLTAFPDCRNKFLPFY